MKEKINNLLQKIKLLKTSLPVRFILLAIVVNLVVEMFCRRSVAEGFKFAATNPLCFLYGVMLILFTLSFVGLVHRKVFMVTLICGIWIIGGIVNFVVTGFRHTPFTAQDFRLVKCSACVSYRGTDSAYNSSGSDFYYFDACMVVQGTEVQGKN